jgi:hypothetical protein
VTHPSTVLWAEVVHIARELHWSLDTLLDLEHPVRRRILAELTAATPAMPATATAGWRG